MKIGAIIQARMGSERLPGKVLKEVGEKPFVAHIIDNLKKSKYLHRIILATTQNEEDIPLLRLAGKMGISSFSGSEDDVLQRYNDAAGYHDLDLVVRVLGDNILTDIDGMDRTIASYLDHEPHMAANSGPHGYPIGTAVEVVGAKFLKEIEEIATSVEEHEHVTLYIFKNPDKYSIRYTEAPGQYSGLDVRLTVDTPEDFHLIATLYEALKEHKEFDLLHVAEYVKQNPEIKKINSHVKQRIVL